MASEDLEAGTTDGTISDAETQPADGEQPGTAEASSAGADAPTVPGQAKPLRWRRRLVLLLVVLASFGVLTSSVAFWTHRTLLNNEAWVDTVGPVAKDPAVQQALAQFVTNQAMNALDTEELLTEALPQKVSFLATPLATAIRNFVYDVVLKLVQSDQFDRLWIAINTYGHQAVVNFLRGDSRVVQADQGVVTLNLVPILSRALQKVQERVPGLLGGKPVPEITYDMPAEQQQQLLQSVVKRQLPPDFAMFELVKSDQLAALQKGVLLFDRVVYVLPIVTLVLIAIALLLSTRRWRTVLQLGIGIALGLSLAVGAVAAIKNQVLQLIVDPTNREAVKNTLAAIIESFQTIARSLIVLGVLLAVAAFLAGDNRFAVAIRGMAGRGSRAAASAAGSVVRSGSETPFPWVATHRSVLFGAGAVVAVAWLLVADVTWGLLLTVVLLLALYELIVWLLSRTPGDDDVATDGPVMAAVSKGPA